MVEHVDEAGWLAILARDISLVLVDLGMPPISGIPQDLHTTGDVLEVVGVILEHLWEAYTSGMVPGISRHSFVAIASIIRPALAF
jgi:hypothetical protein